AKSKEYEALKKQADELKNQLEKVVDLKKVKVSGVPDEEVRIDLQLDKLAELKIPLNVVLGSIQSEAINIPGGNVTAGNKTFNVKTRGTVKDIDEIAHTVIFNANEKIVQLKDVATIGFRNEAEKHITRLNGYRCVLVNAAQKVGGNISRTQAKYLPVIENFQESLPSNISMVKHFDQAENVKMRLFGLGKDFLIAIVLVLFTLAPLGFRASLVVMVAIPLSLALGLVGLNAFGISLNQLSIVGLVVSLGLLVDDSIVVVENTERWLRDGFTPKEAAVKATKQITLAVIGCTATLVIAFLPLIFLPGGPGEFVRGLPLAVITSVIASMLVSLTIVPFISSRILKEHHKPEGNIFLRGLKKIIAATYAKVMKRALNRPVLTLIISFFLFASSLALFPVIGFKLFPTSEKPIFLINIKMPLQTSLQEGNRIAKMVEDSLKKHKEIQFFTTNVGKGNPQIYYNVAQQEEKFDFAQIFVQLVQH
ncbi:MAG: efflux RND transporter permease subunit, partial [Bacteroidia bacterium]